MLFEILLVLKLEQLVSRGTFGRFFVRWLYKAIIIMLVEPCALYAVNSFLVIVPWGAENAIWNFFLAILPETQVRAFP